MKRVFIAIGAAVLIAAPAAGQEKENVVRASLVSHEDGSYLAEITMLQGRVSSPAGVKRAELLIDGTVVAEVTPDDVEQEVDVGFEWDTRVVPGGTEPSSNGRYEITVRGVANGERAEDTHTISVFLDNSPRGPLGLDADVKGPELRLTWQPNPEPDVFAYQIWRSQGKTFALHETVDVTGFYEELAEGTYTYVVVALRNSPVSKKGRASPPSDPLTVVIDGGADGDGSFVVDGKGAAPRGLPDRITFRSFGAGLPELPNVAAGDGSEGDGSYEKKLPYKVPKRFRVLSEPTGERERRWWNVIPPDGLRWLALGLLLLVVAAQARFIAARFLTAS